VLTGATEGLLLAWCLRDLLILPLPVLAACQQPSKDEHAYDTTY